MLAVLVNAGCMLPAFLLPLVLTRGSVPVERRRRYVLAGLGVQYLLWVLNGCALPAPSSAVELGRVALLAALTWRLAEPDRRTAAAIGMTVYVSEALVVVFGLSLALARGGQAADIHSAGYGLMCLAATCAAGPVLYLSHLLLKSVLGRRTLSPWLLLLLPAPLSQVLLVDSILRALPRATPVPGIWASLGLGIGFSVLADICFFIGVLNMRKAGQLEKQVRLAQEQLNTQTGYYRQLQDHILSVNQVRHDLNNQLQAACYLLERGQRDQVRKQLDLLRQSVRERVGPSYCGDLTLDAVLSDKARRCRELGIRLALSVDLPPELPIERAHLCDAVSGLLDYGIRRAQESAAAQPFIDLRGVLRGAFLELQCRASAPARGKGAPSGQDLEIPRQLARRHGGTLEEARHDGVLEVKMTLRRST